MSLYKNSAFTNSIFIMLNFLISFLSDLGLNALSQSNSVNLPKTIRVLRPYFAHYNNSLLTAFYAGLTVITVLILNMLLSKLFFGFSSPVNNHQLLRFLSLAVPLGYVADVFIYKYKVFGKLLDPYYKAGGAGFWGAMAFVFSIVLSYIFIKHI